MFSKNRLYVFVLLFVSASIIAGPIYDSLRIDNININGNTVSSLDTNGNINLNPNGTGEVAINTRLNVSSTTLGSNPCPDMTEAQRDAISSPTAGDCVYNTDNSRLNYYNGSSWQDIGSGAGGGTGVNYIVNTDIESDSVGYSAFDDTSFPPTDGTGDAGDASNVSVARSTTSGTYTPIRGTGSLLFTKNSGADYTGTGFSVDFTVDKGQQARKLTGSVWVLPNDTDCVDDALKITVYDVTNTNMIRVNGEGIKCSSVPYEHYFQFQTASDSTSYRLVFTYDSTDTNEVLYYFDEISVGPTKLAFGTIVTDWKTFTPTGSFNNSTYTGKYRRVGDSLEMQITVQVTGAVTGPTNLEIDLPSGLQMDATKMTEALSTGKIEGTYEAQYNGFGRILGYPVYVDSNTIGALVVDDAAASNHVYTTVSDTFPRTDSVNDYHGFHVSVPIQGWSSNTQISEDLGGREVIVEATNSSTTITNSYSNIVWTNENRDTASAFDGTTFTVPETGNYFISASLWISCASSSTNDTSNVQIVKNGTSLKEKFERLATSSGETIEVDHSAYLQKGDTIRIQALSTATTPVISSSTVRNTLSITKLASPQTMLETETIAFRATSGNAESIPNSTFTTVVYETISFDTHGTYNNSTGVYTIPTSGKYLIKGKVRFGTAISTGLRINVNSGTIYDQSVNSDSTTSQTAQVMDILNLNKGDTVEIQVSQSSGGALTLSPSNLVNNFSIARIK